MPSSAPDQQMNTPLMQAFAGLSNFLVWRQGLGAAVTVALVTILWVWLGLSTSLQNLAFDQYQTWWPREKQSNPAIIVEIDEKSLAAEGQWPWPRTTMARLLDELAFGGTAAVGIDVLFVEPDRLSPQNYTTTVPNLSADVMAGLEGLADHDAILGESLALAPSVLAVAGVATLGDVGVPPSPITGDIPEEVSSYPGLIRSLPELTDQALAEGIINTFVEPDAIVRRPKVLTNVAGTGLLSMPLQMLLVAQSVPSAHVTALLIRLARRNSGEAVLVWALVLMAASLALGPIFFNSAARLLVDGVSPGLVYLAVGLTLVASLSVRTTLDRQALAAEVAVQREEAARLKGELQAARDMQMGLLPAADQVTASETRIDLAAYLDPAREVGGDFYDVFYINPDTLFILVGDVSGKGIPASLFMAISKSIYKSAVLRGTADIGDIMTLANVAIARDNPELLFITLFAAVIDLPTGRMTYSNAGHDNPILLDRAGAVKLRLEEADGPPLCVMDDWEYESAAITMAPQESLLITTDGITEAMDFDGALYGIDHLESVLQSKLSGLSAQDTIAGLLADVATHTKGAPPSDDLTVMFLHYHGD